MFNRGFHQDLPRAVIFKWMLLSVLSGSVNAGGFLAVNRFVTHVTGFAPLFGVTSVRLGRISFAILSVPLFFLLGAVLSSFFIDRRYQQKKAPRYALVFFFVFFCLLAVALLGNAKNFGVFGAELKLSRDYEMLALLCLASGLQNAAITSASGGVVRTTHLTGLTTDLGIGITRVLFPAGDEQVHRGERKALFLKAMSIGSFVLGSAAGAFLFLRFQYLGFLFPAAIAAYMMFQVVGFNNIRSLPGFGRLHREKKSS